MHYVPPASIENCTIFHAIYAPARTGVAAKNADQTVDIAVWNRL
jgi:hypothetical protein